MRRCATDSMTHLHGLAAPYLSVARICAVVKCIPQAAGCLSSPVSRALGGGHREAHKSSGAVTGLRPRTPIPSRRKPPPGRLRPDERVRVGPDPLAAVDGLELLH